MSIVYTPRNDYVLVQRVQLGKTPSGIAVSSASIEGFEHIVTAMGPEVKELALGDKVLVIGEMGKDYAFIPNSNTIFLTKEKNVVMIYDDSFVEDE